MGQPFLTPEELITVMGQFGQPEWNRLKRASEFYARDARMLAADLRQEAYLRALDGRRKCRVGWDVIAFLIGVMKSMVSAERDADAAGTRPMLVGQFGEGGLNPASDALSPEHQVLSAIIDGQTVATVSATIAHDEELVELADAICDGQRGADLQRRLGITTEQLAAARKRLARTIKPILERRKDV